MKRLTLIATVATAPLLAIATMAHAEKTVSSDSRTTPIATSTASDGTADDVKITTAGAITLSTSGAIVTLDSSNSVTNNGSLISEDVSDSIGVLVLGGNTGTVINDGSISLTEDYSATTTSSIVHGAFAEGSGRYGIYLKGTDAFTGDVTNSGSITIEGNDSYGILLESPLIGNLINSGSIAITGDDSTGIKISGGVSGDVTQSGSISVIGENSVGLAVDSAIGGALSIEGSVSATGYRYSSRASATSTLAKIVSYSDNLLESGSAVEVSADVAGGIILTGSDSTVTVDGTTTTTVTTSYSSTGTGSISVIGEAPALLIGSDTQDITIGAVGTDADGYALIIKGSISATGIYDGVTATALQIGGDAGYATTLTGGMRLDGSIGASSYEADATAIHLTSGADVATLFNRGTISSSSYSYAESGATATAYGLVVDAGATLTSLNNVGTIAVTRTGESGDAVAVVDKSGTLTSITNSGHIYAAIVAPSLTTAGDTVTTTATGSAVAFDLTANTTGVTLTQTAATSNSGSVAGTESVTLSTSTATTITPYIYGDVLFGSGDDTLNLLSGYLIGAISFGDGDDVLNIDGGATAYGALYDTDGLGSLTIGSGRLTVTNTDTIAVKSLNLGSDSFLFITANPTTGASTSFTVGTATIASGATIGVRLTSLLTAPTTYTVLTADTLTAGTLSSSVSQAPYLYVASAYAEDNSVYLDVRRRTASEAGMSSGQASAYDSVFAALGQDSTIASAFLNQYTRDGFYNLYDQMLPDTGVGAFRALTSINQQIGEATAERPDVGDRYGPDSVWVQEVNALVRIDDGDTMGSDTYAVGFVAGYEAMGDAGGALGATLSLVSLESKDTAAKVGEQNSGLFGQAGLYWRRSAGGWRFNLGGGGGGGRFDGRRVLISEDVDDDDVADVIIKNRSDWYALTGYAFGGVAYRQDIGAAFVKPEARLDYNYMYESKQEQYGGGDGFDQIIQARSFSNLSANLGVAVGKRFTSADGVWWEPEVRVGYRQTVAGDLGETVAAFTGGGSSFTISSIDDRQGAVTLDLGVKTGSALSYFAMKGGVEATRHQKAYKLTFSGRAMF
ncbi:autotransporter outer membrane beta-barrel domain-containing protein [Caulobacter hibisci]|uniref:Autotransporter outer membrane beta-barrel domain-containing protein n=1 Tax=Caulobacter hibisci TaxID=2035993 RepID=A0ABS0T4L6_9CAUL|nr:autotransporter outer membrane beta-barrel domain-containing protein [Caulobacter hibisci]MBI1686830.1 autotransporter outer membrane beta-barrel domain-containing protein [Caulobacter hibisci]